MKWNVISTSIKTGNVSQVQSGLCKSSAKQYISMLKKIVAEKDYAIYGATDESFVVSYEPGFANVYSIVKGDTK